MEEIELEIKGRYGIYNISFFAEYRIDGDLKNYASWDVDIQPLIEDLELYRIKNEKRIDATKKWIAEKAEPAMVYDILWENILHEYGLQD